MEKQNNIYVTSIVNKTNNKHIYKLNKINHQQKNGQLIKKRNESLERENNRNNFPTSLTYNLSSNVVNQIKNRNNSNYNIKMSKLKVIKKSLEFNSSNEKNKKYKKIGLKIKELPPLTTKLDYANLGIRDNNKNEKLKLFKSPKLKNKPILINNKKEFSELIPDNSINDVYNKLLKYEMNDFCKKKKSKPFKMH
jgi:hypothetical protein